MAQDMAKKRRCPEETANPISRLCFWWMLKFFWKGASKDLQLEDLCSPLKKDESGYLGDQLERSWNTELKKLKTMEYAIGKDGKKIAIGASAPNLFRAIFRVFWWPYLSVGFWIGLNVIVVRNFQPIFQKLIISYFSASGAARTTGKNEALCNAASLVLTTLTIVTINHHSGARAMQVAMRLRVACSTLVYRKLLRLNKAALNDTTPGQIINLLSNDVGRFDTVSALLNFIWIMPIQILVVGTIMWQSVGVVAVVGLTSILILIVPLQLILNKFTRYIRASMAARTDRRVQLMSELINGIQVVKMYAWEKPFERLVIQARALEMRMLRRAAYLRALYLGCMMVTDKIALLTSILTYVSLLGNVLVANVTFPLVTYFNILQAGAAYFFPFALIQASEAAVSVSRLQAFLLLDEVQTDKLSETDTISKNCIKKNPSFGKTSPDLKNWNVEHQSESAPCVEMRRVCANWIFGHMPLVLSEINFRVGAGELCALVGSVASGKSSLLSVILRELPLGSGTVKISRRAANEKSSLSDTEREKLQRGYVVDGDGNVRISYASQEPWLFSGTVRENILFGQAWNAERYEEVTRACALGRDFKLWPEGDRTSVGENGVSLSGGQKARVNLARAVYKRADLYLLDDPLSAVDIRVARHIYEKCINGPLLRDRTRLLATHQVQLLRTSDTIVLLERGTVRAQGKYNDLKDAHEEFRALLTQRQKKNGTMDNSDETIVVTANSKSIIWGMSSVQSVEEKNTLNFAAIIANDDDDGKRSLDGCSDYSEDEEKDASPATPENKDRHPEASSSGHLSLRVVTEYVKSCGSCLVLFLVIFLISLGQLANTCAEYWLGYWTNVEAVRTTLRQNETTLVDYESMVNNTFFSYLGVLDVDGLIMNENAVKIYTVLVIFCVLLNMMRSFLFMHVCTLASERLHQKMFSRILHATMGFYNANPSGRVLNRFSKDVGIMDEMLPRVTMEAVRLCLMMIGVVGMIVYLNHWMILPLFFLVTFFHYARFYYLRTSQAIRRLEGISKSPVFSHVKASIYGLTTIRSSGPDVLAGMRDAFDELQDAHSGAWYLGIIASTTFGFYLDLVSCCFVGSVCFSFILLDDGNTFGGNVGLAISQALLMTGVLQYGAKQSAEAMIYMTSVERIVQYTDLPTEGPLVSENPPPSTWPAEGRISLEHLCLRYGKDETPVLKDVNVRIEAGWKVGVVGRTGAGKSSLIVALFRLEKDGTSGSVIIDDLDTARLGLHELRSKISIIPQEPVLFSGTLRYNLDPFGAYTDARLWQALKEVELDGLSLDHVVQEGGSNFSVGQRQLVCLARAVLKNNRILVLDEATANIDSRTDSVIQTSLRTRFARQTTVLTIAHRLNTVIDSDRILVMDAGQVAEFGCPNYLLGRNPDGAFARMVGQAGIAVAANLREAARRACVTNPKHDCYKSM